MRLSMWVNRTGRFFFMAGLGGRILLRSFTRIYITANGGGVGRVKAERFLIMLVNSRPCRSGCSCKKRTIFPRGKDVLIECKKERASSFKQLQKINIFGYSELCCVDQSCIFSLLFCRFSFISPRMSCIVAAVPLSSLLAPAFCCRLPLPYFPPLSSFMDFVSFLACSSWFFPSHYFSLVFFAFSSP